MWDLPGPGLEPMSPALAGGFLTTVPPGKSCLKCLEWGQPPDKIFAALVILGGGGAESEQTV